MQRKMVWAVTLGLLVFLFIGCEEEGLSFKTDEKFRGKWQTQTMRVNWGTHPVSYYTVNGMPLTSRGWEIGERTINLYHNGALVETITDVYTSGSSFIKIDNDTNTGYGIEVNGNSAIIWYPSAHIDQDNCTKVGKFSWE
jgi:hypothetical protein